MADEGDDAWSSSSAYTPSFRFRWDVFQGFRGEDTRHNFTDRLYNELVRNGIRTFRDDEELEQGNEIAPSLLTAIEESAASIAIISKNYASSRWCLEELAKIIECRRLILPVFYQVDPSHVRRQMGPFEEAFQNLELRFGVENVGRWRKAMEKAGGISGWDSRIWEEPLLIQSLVKKVLTKLSNIPLGVAKFPVGLNSRLETLLRMLDVKANGVHMLGFHGMGGVGKTTLAKALYNKLVIHFDKELKFLPPLPSSLIWLNVANCTSLESIPDLSNLECLEDLQLTNCKKVMDIPGLKCLKSLRRLYRGGCNACLPAVKRRLAKVALKHLKYFSLPRNKIPDWFVEEILEFSSRKNLELKAVIIGVVVSLDQQQADSYRDKVPAIVDIQAKITRLNQEYHQVIHMLKDGDKIEVAMRTNPRFNGLELKKRGIYLVFENDDDNDDDDEELFNESQQSVSKNWPTFSALCEGV